MGQKEKTIDKRWIISLTAPGWFGLCPRSRQRISPDLIRAVTFDYAGVEAGLQDAVKTLHADILVLRHQPHGWVHKLLLGDHSKKMPAGFICRCLS